MKVFLDEKAFEPVRAHDTDAGLDIRSPSAAIVPPRGGSCVIKTGVHIELPKGTAGLMVSKSGLNVNRNIMSTGLVDEGYTGEIVVKLYNFGSSVEYIQAGDKITQLVVVPVRYEPAELVFEPLKSDGRGDAGFGSTGR